MGVGRGEATAQGGPAHAALPWQTQGPGTGVRRVQTHKGTCLGAWRGQSSWEDREGL